MILLFSITVYCEYVVNTVDIQISNTWKYTNVWQTRRYVHWTLNATAQDDRYTFFVSDKMGRMDRVKATLYVHYSQSDGLKLYVTIPYLTGWLATYPIAMALLKVIFKLFDFLLES